eukprot:33305_1
MTPCSKSVFIRCFLPVIFLCYGVLLYNDPLADYFTSTPLYSFQSPVNVVNALPVLLNQSKSINNMIENGTERFNITYDRERACLTRTYGYTHPLQWSKFSDPIILWEWNYSTYHHDIRPDQSIIVTVYDYLNVADLVIESILKLSRGKYELIVVLDEVDDESIHSITQVIQQFNYDCSLDEFAANTSSKVSIPTAKHAREYLDQKTLIHDYCMDYKHKSAWKNTCGMLQRIVLIRAWGVWEASANNLGMCVSSVHTSFYVHVQDDMQMTQIGWNMNIILPLSIFSNDLFSISARCGTPIQNAFQGLGRTTAKLWQWMDDEVAQRHGKIKQPKTSRPGTVGRCGANIDKPLPFGEWNKSIVYERTGSNRGPFAVNASDMRAIGFLNERSFKLGFDIPELHLRSLTFLHKHSGFFPLQFRAELSWGGTRRKRRNKTETQNVLNREYERWRNQRRDATNAFEKAGANRSIANYVGERVITLKMIDGVDDLYHFCE